MHNFKYRGQLLCMHMTLYIFCMCTMYDCVYRKTEKKCSNYSVKPCKATLVVVSQLTQVCRLVARQQGL